MTSDPTPTDPAAEEAASLYVLDLLAAEERRDFERRLDRDPALRGLVREFQNTLDALVLAPKARPAPLRVWGHIAAEVQAREARVLRFPASMPWWLKQLLAAAACLTLGALLHAWLNPPPPKPPPVAADDQPADPPETLLAESPAPITPPPTIPRPMLPVPQVIPPAPAAPVPTTNTEIEASRLRERVQILASQVAALNQVLTQRQTLPSGVTRLHVLRLTNANASEANAPEADVPEDQRNPVSMESLPQALAALAARQHIPAPPSQPPPPTASVPDAPDAPPAAPAEPKAPLSGMPEPQRGEVEPETPGELVLASQPAATSATAAASAVLNNGQPLGFYDPETGHGAIALISKNPSPDTAYAVWSRTIGADGRLVVQNVGVASAANPTTVISFNTTGNLPSPPTFFVTVELRAWLNVSGGPTGPIVAEPPTSVP